MAQQQPKLKVYLSAFGRIPASEERAFYIPDHHFASGRAAGEYVNATYCDASTRLPWKELIALGESEKTILKNVRKKNRGLEARVREEELSQEQAR